MASLNQTPSTSSNDIQSNKRKLEDSSDQEDNSGATPNKILNSTSDHWPRFIVLSCQEKDKQLTKVSPFVIQKFIQGVAGEVKKVTKLRSGSLMVECSRPGQSKSLLSAEKILNIPISASPHKSLNSSQGIIRDRDRDLAEFSEEQILNELKDQGITAVKQFVKKREKQKIKYISNYIQYTNSSTINKNWIF